MAYLDETGLAYYDGKIKDWTVSDAAVTAAGSTAGRTLPERFADAVTAKDFGAKGDGTTNDTAAFTALEQAVSGRVIDLCGLAYAVDSIPSGNTYCNGSFIVLGRTYSAYGNNIFAYWNPAGNTQMGVGNGDLNFFISDGISTPSSIEAARLAVPHLKDVIAIGNRAAYGATRNNSYLSDCIALGSGVMSYGDMTSSAEHNIGVGEFALHRITSGDRNIGIGSLSLVGLTSGRCNIAIGRDCCQGITSGSYSVAIGYCAMGEYGWSNLYGEIDGQTKITGSNNIAVGAYAASKLSGTSGDNTIVGYAAALEAKLASRNVALGEHALYTAQLDTSLNGKVLIADTLQGTYSQSGTTVTVTMPGHHAVVGCYVAFRVTSGGIPASSYLEYVTSVSGDTFTIYSDVPNDTSGDCEALEFEQGEDSTQMAAHNCVIGVNAACYQKDASYSVAVGFNALRGSIAEANSKMENSTAVGYRAFESCYKAARATGVGYCAGLNSPEVSMSVVIGDYAALSCAGAINGCVIVGSNAANGVQTALSGTVLMGSSAGNIKGSMSYCTFIGHQAMYDSSDTSTYTNSTAIGYQAKVSGSNQVQLGKANTTVYAYGAVQDRSDARDKADIRDTQLGLDFLCSLHPVDFRWDYRDDYFDYVERDVETIDSDGKKTVETIVEVIPVEKDGSRKRTRYHHGLIAQEVKAILDEKRIDFGGYQDHRINGGKDILTLGYEEFIGPIIKAIQEIDARLSALEA